MRLIAWGIAGFAAASFVASVVATDTGVGVCAQGIGFRTNDPAGPGPWVGVNVGTDTVNAVFLDQRRMFEEECCRQAGRGPECFDDVARDGETVSSSALGPLP